jgi:hypothetical protein
MLAIAEDDEKLQHLAQTSQDIAKKLQKKRMDIINHTLVTLDPNTPPDDPVLEQVEAALKKHWKTFRNKFPDTPRQMLRPVILQALYSMGSKNPLIASIIWLTGTSSLPFVITGREKEIYDDFLSQMGTIAESKAIEEWSSSYDFPSISLSAIEFDLSKVKTPSVNETKLAAFMAMASGPQDQQGQPGEDPNQYWPDQGQHWAHQFAPRAANGIARVVNESYSSLLASITESLEQSSKKLTEYASAIDSAVRESVEQMAHTAVVNERRNLLLWWKETLYSATQNQSYRTLDTSLVVLLMAFDLHNQVPEYCPQSVEYLLRETVREVLLGRKEKAPDNISFDNFFKDLQSVKEGTNLSDLFSGGKKDPCRISMLSFIEYVLTGAKFNSKEILSRTGIKADSKIELENLSVWLFRDLQARRLASLKE